VRHEDAPNLQNDGDFQGNDDEGVDSDRYVEELGCDRVSLGAGESLQGSDLRVHAPLLS